MLLHVTGAEYIDGCRVHVWFNDGTDGEIDLSGSLGGPIFEPLRDAEYFKSFSLVGHTLTWPNGADFAPEYLRSLVRTPADADLMMSLQDYLTERGATFVACAHLRGVPVDARQGLDRGVAIGLALDAAVIAGIDEGPTPAYATEYERANGLLDDLARLAAEFLRARGHRAVPLAATVETVDKATLATPLPHKTTARLAGLGWIGKCALLITRSHGSAVRYNTVLTDAPLPVGMPADVSECGPCTACVDACPTAAPSGRDWQPGMSREELLDAWACCNDAQRRAAALGMDNVICGICIAACPHTKRYVARSERTEAVQPDQETEAP